MSEFLAEIYLWSRALHVIAVIAWMAGMFYLPRLFVYHNETAAGSEASETFKVMERRLLRAIINPAMIGAWIFGFALLFTPGVVEVTDIWFHVKFGAVLLMSGMHGVFSSWRKEFERDERRRRTRVYRIANEIPTLLVVIIVIMVIVRPF